MMDSQPYSQLVRYQQRGDRGLYDIVTRNLKGALKVLEGMLVPYCTTWHQRQTPARVAFVD